MDFAIGLHVFYKFGFVEVAYFSHVFYSKAPHKTRRGAFPRLGLKCM
jgi:hypothetical protein